MIATTMGLSETAVKYAVYRLSARHQTYSLADIAAYIGCTERTIKNVMPKLIQAGVIRRTGNTRRGFRYELIEERELL